MGTMGNAYCASCGYSKGFSEGVGMHSLANVTAYSPGLCLGCRELVTVEYRMLREGEPSDGRDRFRCPECHRPVDLYYPHDPFMARSISTPIAEQDGQGREWWDGFSFLCPKCGEKELRFVAEGLWD